MVRIDIWDVQNSDDFGPIDCGFPRDFDKKYKWGRTLGKGGFGVVRIVIEVSTGKEYACKTIDKRLDVPNFSPQRQATHLDNVKREIAVQRRLRGTLNVAQLKEALEDDNAVHIVMEYCRGGELWNYIGKLRHYSERTVASFIRAVLRTIAQCHFNNVLHRDIKSSNFMLLEDSPFSPVKAIDFGMAVFYEPGNLPRRDLGLEGTPWFMSPETLSSQVGPPSDVWAAGIMAYQLLSGYLPFDDHKNRDAPALSKIWKSILTDEVVFKCKAWEQVSEPAREFVLFLLNKDPNKRPTAKEALQHRWLVGGHKDERMKGVPLRQTVVQRIQRYGQGSILKRTILELIAQEIIKMAPETPEPSNHDRAATPPLSQTTGKREAEESPPGTRAAHLLSSIKRRKSQRALAALAHGPGGGAMEGPPLIHRDHHSVHGGMEYYTARGESVHNARQALEHMWRVGRPSSMHGSNGYWRLMRAAATAMKWKNGAVQERNTYLRYMPRCEDEREEQRKAARLALDTSTRGTPEYKKFLLQCSPRQMEDGGAPAGSESNGRHAEHPSRRETSQTARQSLFPVANSLPERDAECPEQRVRGRHAYRQFITEQNRRSGVFERKPPLSPPLPPRSHSLDGLSTEQNGHGHDVAARRSGLDAAFESRLPRTSTDPGLLVQMDDSMKGALEAQQPKQEFKRKVVSFTHLDSCDRPPECMDTSGAPRGSSSDTGTVREMKDLLRKLNFTRDVEGISEEALADGLQQLGYQLRQDELQMLTKQMDPRSSAGAVSKSAFLASQMDWSNADIRQLWMDAARKVFADLEKYGDGKLSSAALMSMVREKVPEAEVEYAIEDALVEAGYADEEEMDFDGFLRILHDDSSTSLDAFEARLPHASQDNLASPALPPHLLSTVTE